VPTSPGEDPKLVIVHRGPKGTEEVVAENTTLGLIINGNEGQVSGVRANRAGSLVVLTQNPVGRLTWTREFIVSYSAERKDYLVTGYEYAGSDIWDPDSSENCSYNFNTGVGFLNKEKIRVSKKPFRLRDLNMAQKFFKCTDW
jgi:hypothetical protein